MNYLTQKKYNLIHIILTAFFAIVTYNLISNWDENKAAFIKGFNDGYNNEPYCETC